jgi:hypothetical protein
MTLDLEAEAAAYLSAIGPGSSAPATSWPAT